MLYTLSVFAIEPVKWVKQYEWRELTDMEICALGTFWKSMGEALDVAYTELPSCGRDGGWRDGWEWWHELREWSRSYEERHMVLAGSNKMLADGTLDLLLWRLPGRLRGIGKNVVAVLLEERLRVATGYGTLSP